MVALPASRAVTVSALSTETIVASDEVHTNNPLRSCVLPSLWLPVALICAVVPVASRGFGGATMMDSKAADLTVKVVEFDTAPSVAALSAPQYVQTQHLV